jgi:flagellar basal body rod protein FlgC
MLRAASTDLSKALKIDGGVTKRSYFVFIKEDKMRYLTIPSNSKDLIKLPGWDALFSLLNELGIAMKFSDLAFENPGSSVETRKFFAGLAHRVSKTDWDSSEDTFMISSTNAAERGRVTADLYALKKRSSVMNLEKYLPASSRVGKTSYIRHYLSLLSGPNNVETLKAIPDLVNKIMSNWVETFSAEFDEISEKSVLSIGQVVNDLTRKKKKKVRKDGKSVDIMTPIHAARVSDSPFAITDKEEAHLRSLEGAWDDLQKFNSRYSKGVPVTEIESARDTFKEKYDDQMKYAQKTGSFKSRRLEAFKELASLSMSSREMRDFKLTKKTKDLALDNFAKAIDQYDPDKRAWPIDMEKVILNMKPGNMPGYQDTLWNYINGENVLYLYGKLQPSNRKRIWLSKRSDDIHDELSSYFPSVTTLERLSPASLDLDITDIQEEED